MTPPIPPLPPHGGYIRAVRECARAARTRANITISEESMKRFLISPAFTSSFERLRKAHGMIMPLKFDNVLAELNVLTLLALLNFGSGYRVPLHAATGRGAFDNIRALVFGMYISSSAAAGDMLSAQGLRAMEASTVADLMGVSDALHVEHEHESIPGLTVGELGGPIWELVQMITKTMNETGNALVESGYPDLGAFVMEALKEGEKAKNSQDPDLQCDVILERLVRAIPALRDMSDVNGQAVYCFKKALLTIHAIHLRFASATSSPIPIPDTDHLPIFVDNVIPSMLIHLGVINLSTSEPSLGLTTLFSDTGNAETLEALLALEAPRAEEQKDAKIRKVPKGGPILTTEQAYILRAAAIDACELLVESAIALGESNPELEWMKGINPPDLDAWIWAVAKDRADYRKLERFVLRGTSYF
ncbi:hypothetical protein OBBRIDRAFT_793496 [Obba rivulosa]|uniref:Queuosine 5'-phosphate N-glycosylase/hydrolase n=1 Tax=Obba rivulosa TaxID=1052685 RepID=A0A8E2AY76_9APHY|nr:hypothetical protein OBBRIDRAFT_793496 [Obba rivulosa]